MEEESGGFGRPAREKGPGAGPAVLPGAALTEEDDDEDDEEDDDKEEPDREEGV